VVALEFEETLRYDDGSFRLRFPLAITPRYIPGAPFQSTGDGSIGSLVTQQVPDADRITPPYVTSREGYVNPVTIAIDLDAGFPLSRLNSTYHAMNVEELPGNRYRLTMEVPGAGGARLRAGVDPEVGAAPGAALFH